MEFSKEAKDVINTVLKVQSKDCFYIKLLNIAGGKQVHFDVKNLEDGEEAQIIDNIPVITDEDTLSTLSNIRFIVADGGLCMERIDGCTGCCACQKNE